MTIHDAQLQTLINVFSSRASATQRKPPHRANTLDEYASPPTILIIQSLLGWEDRERERDNACARWRERA